MIETIEYNGKKYPAIQAEGNAAQYIMTVAYKFCKGIGYDIGCNRIEWMMKPNYDRKVVPIDPAFSKETRHVDELGFTVYFTPDGSSCVEWSKNYHATKLPKEKYNLVDFIFSSHCLEHIEFPWFSVLEYWKDNLKEGGVIFLYLPDYSQEYWRPWNNRKHVHAFTPELLYDAFVALDMKNIFVSGIDMMNSFAIVGEK